MYKFQVFPILELIQVQDGEVSSLFRIDAATEKLKKVSYAQNQRHLVVHENLDLIETDNGLYCSGGRKLTSLTGKIEIIPYLGNFLVLTRSENHCHILLKEGRKVSVSMDCQDFAHGSAYYAFKIADEWLIFQHLDLIHTLHAEHVEFHRNLLLYETPVSKKCLYDLHDRKIICMYMDRIVLSNLFKFALCTDHQGKAYVYHKNIWKHFGEVDDFGILADGEKLFYLKKKDKYYLYHYNGFKMFKVEYPKGMDKIYYSKSEKSLMIINNGDAEFLYNT